MSESPQQSGPPVGVSRRRFTTADVDAATELIRSRYADHRPVFFGDRERFRFEVASTEVEAAAGRFQVDRVRHSMGVRAPTEPANDLLITVPVGPGRFVHRLGRETITGACLMPYWRPCVTEWDELDCAVGVLDLDGVRRVGAELSGLDVAEVEFTGWRPLSPGWEQAVISVLSHVTRVVASDVGVPAAAPLRSEAFRHLAVVMLGAFPNTTHTMTPVTGQRGGPATVRRAVAFIDDHAHEDIDITQIADAARIGPRGLQAAFRRHRGQTPLEYLRRVRVEGAHRDLERADPTRGDTVAGIAARWGFRHPGRFSVDYHRTFGVSPSHTLRQ